jgi:hypothetical protein
MNELACKNCAFWKRHKITKDLGSCHRYPPVMEPADGVVTWLWPMTNAEAWCGEWKKEFVYHEIELQRI